jgi:hypothetical protein
MMQAAGIGTTRDCTAALLNLRLAVNRVPTAPPARTLANGFKLLASGNPSASVLEYARAAEMGSSTAAWNAAYILDEGLANDAAASSSSSLTRGALGAGAGARVNASAAAPASQSLPASSSASSSPSPLLAYPVETAAWAVREAVLGVSGLLGLPPAHPVPSPTVDAERAALRFYLRAASGGASPHAELKVADYLFGGRGGLNVSYAAAADKYRIACTGHIPEGCYALGYAYERGLGVPADHHLAKRFYDLTTEEQRNLRAGAGANAGGSAASAAAAAANAPAPVPVRVALARLQHRRWLGEVRAWLIAPLCELLGLQESVLPVLDDWLGTGPWAAAAEAEAARREEEGREAKKAAAAAAAAAKKEAKGGPTAQPSAGKKGAKAPATKAPAASPAPATEDAGDGDGGGAAGGVGGDRVQAALTKSRAQRAARQKSNAAEALGGGFVGAVAGVYQAWAGFVNGCVWALARPAHALLRVVGGDWADELHPEDSLFFVLVELLGAVLIARGLRRRREWIRWRGQLERAA